MLSISLLLLLVQLEQEVFPTPHPMLIPAAGTVCDSAVTACATTDLQLLLSGTGVLL